MEKSPTIPVKKVQRALCLACGSEKAAPLEECAKCQYRPESENDQAEHMLLATFEFTLEELEATQESLRNGVRPAFHPDSMLTMTSALKADRPDAHWLLFWVFFAVPIVAFFGYVVYAWLQDSPMD